MFPSCPLPTPTLQGTQLDSRRPGSRPRPKGLLGELYLDSMGIIRPYFPGQLSERLQVRREGLPLETPTPPPSQAVETSRAHCSWNNGPRSFQDQGEPIGCRSQQGPGPWQTPWQLDRSLGEHSVDHGLQWQRPRVCPSHGSHPQSRKGAASAPPHSWGAHPRPSKPSCPRCAVSRHLAGGPGAPRATMHGVTSSAGRAGAVPPRVEAWPPPSLPSPSHTQTVPAACLQREPGPSPLQSDRRTL